MRAKLLLLALFILSCCSAVRAQSARQFLSQDGFTPIAASDLPALSGMSGVLPYTKGGTGRSDLGPTNSFLTVGGPSGLFWRKLTDQMIQPEYRTGVGPSIVTATITAIANGDMLVYNSATGEWYNTPVPVGGAHDLLSATHTDTLASAVTKGSLIVGNSTPKWEELNVGADGTTIVADSTNAKGLKWSGGTGQSSIAFASYLYEDSVTVTGQAGIASTSSIQVQVYADGDDVIAQDWLSPEVKNIVAGTGFDIVLRPKTGAFKGAVKVNWAWR